MSTLRPSSSYDPTATRHPNDSGGKTTPVHDDTRDSEDPVTSNSGERVKALRGWNATQLAIGKLPWEILSLIFQATCPPAVFGAEKGGNPPVLVHIVLSQVCLYWREVVQATPQLWTRLTLYLNPVKFNHAVSLLLQFLNRSGDLPLTLALYFSPHMGIPVDSLVHEDIDPLLLKNLPRIRGLDLSVPPEAWLSPALPPLGQLSSLTLSYIQRPLILGASPHLRHLHITRVLSPILLQPSCQTITTLRLSTSPIDVCATIMSQCPRLVELRNYRPHYVRNRDTPVWPTERTSFLDIKVFEWEILSSEGDDITWQSAVLNNTNLPSLQYLRWSHPRWLRNPFPYEHTAGGFFSGLPATLTKLTFYGIHALEESNDYSSTVTRIRNDANVEQITFAKCNAKFILEIVRSLEPQPGVQLKFPGLRDITIESFLVLPPDSSTVERTRSISHSLINMLEHRMRMLGAPFSIHLVRSPDLKWPPDARRMLAELKKHGFQLEIFEDLESVKWLA